MAAYGSLKKKCEENSDKNYKYTATSPSESGCITTNKGKSLILGAVSV
jgi:hypothetical protein